MVEALALQALTHIQIIRSYARADICLLSEREKGH